MAKLKFGTGGIRALMGHDEDMLNIETVSEITQGYADYIKEKKLIGRPSIVIGYDNRHNSKSFAQEVARLLSINDIRSYISPTMITTPEISFAVRNLKCVGGIMITASHNPKEYNGFKVYDYTGCQLLPGESEVLAQKIQDASVNKNILSKKEALIDEIPGDLKEKYLNKLILNSYGIDMSNLNTMYTPLHGTGSKTVPKLFEKLNLGNLYLVEEQMVEDPDFTTVADPNPEKTEAFVLALKQADKIKPDRDRPDIILGTDPDSDRLGVLAAYNGQYRHLTGNETACLLLDFIGQVGMKGSYGIDSNAFIIKSIVSTKLADAIANAYEIDIVNVLPGFKYIGDKLNQLTEGKFLFAFEESCGYLKGEHLREKDGVESCLSVAEMCAYYKNKGISLVERLEELIMEHGDYRDELLEFTLERPQDIADIMSFLRSGDIFDFFDTKIIMITDYLKGESRSLGGGGDSCAMSVGTRPTKLPKEDVLAIKFANGVEFIARPSGTEPKIKFYLNSGGNSDKETISFIDSLKASLNDLITSIEK